MKSSVVITELERMSPVELERDLRLKRAEAAGQRMDLEMQKGKDSAKYKALRKDIARMSMVLHKLSKGKKAAATPAKTASKVEKNPVQDSGSVKKKAAKPTATKKKTA
ncbi:MAG TPA: 50S ribosomal protein L29 [Candidatus Peribacteria bacterium]|nr:50S ribosomal protein L29 [Candidatus Peribacteria bacterium]